VQRLGYHSRGVNAVMSVYTVTPQDSVCRCCRGPSQSFPPACSQTPPGLISSSSKTQAHVHKEGLQQHSTAREHTVRSQDRQCVQVLQGTFPVLPSSMRSNSSRSDHQQQQQQQQRNTALTVTSQDSVHAVSPPPLHRSNVVKLLQVCTQGAGTQAV
jgi:hypothetical protein